MAGSGPSGRRARRSAGRRGGRRAGHRALGAAGLGALLLAACNLGEPADTYPLTGTGNSAADLVAGDLDEDGDVDLVAPVGGGYTVGLNDGAGGFAISQVPTFPAPGWLADLGDVDGDGHLDIAYVAGSPSGDPPAVEVRRGNGAGRFSTTRQVLPGGPLARDLALADLDGDDDLDVVAASDAGAAVWLNDGSGAFGRPFAVDTGTNASDIAVGDLDGDGAADVVTGGFSSAAVVSVNLGDGSGGFGDPTTYGIGPVDGFFGTTTVGVADLNDDGVADVYGGNGTHDRVFAFLGSGDGDGTLGPAILSPAGTSTVPDLVAVDIDVDGHLDLATGGMVLFGDGAGRFPEQHPIFGGDMVVPADFDADDQPDLAYAQGADMRVLLNRLDGRRDHDNP